MKSKKISIILPTFNEAGNIIPLIEEISAVLSKRKFEIIVIDDNSPDGTYEIILKKYQRVRKIRIFRRFKDRGLANAIIFGIYKSLGNLIIVMDTDFNHDPKLLPVFIKNCNQYDLIIGSRYIKGGGMENRIRYIFSYIYNLIIRSILKLKTHDNLSGFYIIKKDKLFKLKLKEIYKGYGDYFIRLLKDAHEKNLNIKEIPVFYNNRRSGESKTRFLKIFLDYTKTVASLTKSK